MSISWIQIYLKYKLIFASQIHLNILKSKLLTYYPEIMTMNKFIFLLPTTNQSKQNALIHTFDYIYTHHQSTVDIEGHIHFNKRYSFGKSLLLSASLDITKIQY